MQGVWDGLPVDIRDKANQLKEYNEPLATEVLDYLIAQIADAQSRNAPSRNAEQSEGNSLGSAKSAGRKKASDTEFEKKWQMSQILPARRAVNVCVSSKTLATYKVSDGELCDEGSWSTFNVFLQLPVPKRPKPQFNLVLTKLGGEGPFIVLSSSDVPPDLTKYLATHAKYADTSASASQAVPAYIGAREGLLYLLDDFLFFGFRKPLLLFLLAEIESVSITMVTSRTFNVFVKLLDDTTHEFEKLPHEYSQHIMDYVAKHNLNDTSMAEERKAKRQRTQPSALEEAVHEANQPAARDGSDDDSDDEDDDDFESGSESA